MHHRRFLLVATATLPGLFAQVASAESSPDDRHQLHDVRALAARRGPAPVTIYLNRAGGTLTAGWDDSTQDVSTLATRGDGGEVTIPAWRGGDRRWRQVAACVRERFAAFAIDIVEDRPARGDYIMVMVGGRASLLGLGARVSGVAPYTGEVIPRGVSFVFPENIRNAASGTCESILHEAGHALGLDHAYLCEDPMSYLYGCGEKRFQDQDAYCGEDEPRACSTDDGTQNSYQHLAQAVGLRDAGNADVDVDRDVDVDDDGDGDDRPVDPYTDPEAAPAAPTITLDNGRRSSDIVTFTASAASSVGIADVVLLWGTTEASYAWACSAIPDDVPATCERSGDTFTFRLRVGTGRRGVAAVAIDNTGAHTATPARSFYLR